MDDLILARYKSALEQRLSAQDDIQLWLAVWHTLVPEIELLAPIEHTKWPIYVEIGACTHWLRPHQTRWKANGGFAAPFGYNGGEPEHEWSLLRKHVAGRWRAVARYEDKKRWLCRISVPTRSARHDAAAICVKWPSGAPLAPAEPLTLFYGFRKQANEWSCVASYGFPDVELISKIVR